jgi:anti-anti-sigma factor
MGATIGRLRGLDPRLSYALQLVAVTALYTGSGKLGLDLAFATRSVTAVWPPTGIALAALILGGYRLWPAVAAGALLTNLNTGVPAGTVLGIVCGNTLEALAGAFLLRHVTDFNPSLRRVKDVFALVAAGALLSTMVSATIGVASLLIGDAISWAHAASVWRTWWLGDMGGDLIVAPALLVAATSRQLTRLPGRPDEGAMLVALLAGVSVVVFSQSTNVVYALFPLLIWAALRFWQPGAAIGSLLVAAVAVAFTANGKGPFATYGPDDRLLLAQTFVAVAGLTALVLAAVTSERGRAETAEREIAETLQRSLLPDAAPAVAGWEIATMYRPAGAAEVEVGGDFYDFFPTGTGCIAILGDVAGKGVDAAAMAALVRHGARFASQTETSPAAILARLDDALRQQPALALCSALCVRVQPDHLLISSAGHPEPMIVRGDGRVREIGGGGPMLGAVRDPTWPERFIPVGSDEMVLLYTDGVTDTHGGRDRFGQRRLKSFLSEHADLDPDGLLSALEAALDSFQRGPQSDDTAALALRLERLAAAPRARRRLVPRRQAGRARPSHQTFALETMAIDGVFTVKVSGEIDHATAERVLKACEHGGEAEVSELVLDFGDVEFIDTAGLRTIIEAERRARDSGHRFQILSPRDSVRAVFRVSGAEVLLPPADGVPPLDYAERVWLELDVNTLAPRLARAELREVIAGKLSEVEFEMALLLTSELVTNAVVHPQHKDGASIGLQICADEGRLRVEVSDSGGGFDPARLTRDEQASGGRGLLVVNRGSARWGTIRDDRFRVWFELEGSRADARVERKVLSEENA